MLEASELKVEDPLAEEGADSQTTNTMGATDFAFQKESSPSHE